MAWEWKSRKDLIWVLESCHSVGRQQEEEGQKGKEKRELKHKSRKAQGMLGAGRARG